MTLTEISGFEGLKIIKAKGQKLNRDPNAN